MRGVVAYGADPVVCIVDSERAGETYEGIPIVGSVDEALRFGPTVALVGVATQGGRFPPAWRELLKSAISSGLDLENGLHELVGTDPELTELARRHGVELRDLRQPPAGLNVPTGENLDVSARVVLDGRIRLRDREDDRRPRARPGGEAARHRLGLRADGPDRDRDRRLGDLDRRRRRRLRRRRRRAPRRRGGRRAAASCSGSRARGRSLHPAYSGVTLGLIHGAAPARLRPLPPGGLDRDRGLPRAPPADASGARGAPRANRASPPAGARRGDRPEHPRPRRRGGAVGRRPGRAGDRAPRGRSCALRGGKARRRPDRLNPIPGRRPPSPSP